MSIRNKEITRSITVHGATVTTATGNVKKGSRQESKLKLIDSLYQERQLVKRAREVALILMDELEIPDNASIVGYLCGGVAKSNVKEICNWILRETASSIDGSELYCTEYIKELSFKLINILMEIQDGYC